MIGSKYDLPFKQCTTCLKYSNCPIHMQGIQGRIKVPDPKQCVLEQVSPTDLATIADQIQTNLGLIECQKETLRRKLDIVLGFMQKHDKKVVTG